MKRTRRITILLHIICLVITSGVAALGVFVFGGAFGRFWESIRDLGLSAAYFFCDVSGIEHNIVPTVNELSAYLPEIPFPSTFENFKIKWSEFWALFIDKSNFLSYCDKLGLALYDISIVLLILAPFVVIFVLAFNLSLRENGKPKNKDSKPLKAYKTIVKYTVRPVKRAVSVFIAFLLEHGVYYKLWIAFAAFFFNGISIAVSFFAFYFYFVATFDFSSIYRQIYKLLIDITPAAEFIPGVIWCVIGLILFDRMRKKIGYARLNHYERRNRGFINARPIVYMVCGSMGKKKTTIITDMSLSQEVMLRDKAFEKLLENDMKFPYFPWCNLESALRQAMNKHTVYNLATVKRYISHIKALYEACKAPETGKAARRRLRRKFGLDYPDMPFGYDGARYGFTYNDGLKVTDIWDVLENYAQLYFIYVLQSSYILSNYSIRTDNILSDLGHFPLWDNEFFRRDSRLSESYSRHSHILDFDALRLGRRILENNPRKDSFEFGVVVITEIGKERGNNLENQDKKKKDDSTNQKNDLFNSWLKMVRHSATVDNFPFVRVITDEQRPESWGADARDLCEIVRITDSGTPRLAMPFFAFGELLHAFFAGRFSDLYYRYRYVRSDNTLFMYLFKGVAALIEKYYAKIYNRFGYCAVKVAVESGTQDGQTESNKYYLMTKKIYSRRFATDCHGDFFLRKALHSPVGLNDLTEYAGERATLPELKAQNSYFIGDLLKMENKNDE